MSAGWVAGSVRAKGLLSRRLGPEAPGDCCIGVACRCAARSGRWPLWPGHRDRPERSSDRTCSGRDSAVAFASARGLAAREGARAIRSLAAGFEAANIIAHAHALAGAVRAPSFDLGALATAWSRLRETSSLLELRRALAQSLWGDPGGGAPADIAAGVQVSWAVRVATTVPEASSWAVAALALLVACRHLAQRRRLLEEPARAAWILGPAAMAADDLCVVHRGAAGSGPLVDR